jgi:predicted lipid-binding transport protein (Tim44 family)
MIQRHRRLRPVIAFVTAAAAFLLLFVAAAADARVGNGSSTGTRGLRTISVPPSTRAAPKAATQADRSIKQVGQSLTSGRSANPPASVIARPGLLGGVTAGFLGAGLFGLVSGSGAVGGLDGFASIFGLLLQFALVAFVAALMWMWFARRRAPAFAGLSPRELADVYGRPRTDGLSRAPDADAQTGAARR